VDLQTRGGKRTGRRHYASPLTPNEGYLKKDAVSGSTARSINCASTIDPRQSAVIATGCACLVLPPAKSHLVDEAPML